jgi:hypothetical protein
MQSAGRTRGDCTWKHGAGAMILDQAGSLRAGRRPLIVLAASLLAGIVLAAADRGEAASRAAPALAARHGVVLAQAGADADKMAKPPDADKKAKPTPRAKTRGVRCGGPGGPACPNDMPAVVRCGEPDRPCPSDRPRL